MSNGWDCAPCDPASRELLAHNPSMGRLNPQHIHGSVECMTDMWEHLMLMLHCAIYLFFSVQVLGDGSSLLGGCSTVSLPCNFSCTFYALPCYEGQEYSGLGGRFHGIILTYMCSSDRNPSIPKLSQSVMQRCCEKLEDLEKYSTPYIFVSHFLLWNPEYDINC